MVPLEKEEENLLLKREKRTSRARAGTLADWHAGGKGHTQEIKGGVIPCLWPFSPVVCIEYPCMTGAGVCASLSDSGL